MGELEQLEARIEHLEMLLEQSYKPSAQDVESLRVATGSSYSACSKSLRASRGSIEVAMDYLRYP